MDLCARSSTCVSKELIQTLRDRRMLFILIARAGDPARRVRLRRQPRRSTTSRRSSATRTRRRDEPRARRTRFFAEGTFVRRGEALDPDRGGRRALESGDVAAVALIVPARLRRAPRPRRRPGRCRCSSTGPTPRARRSPRTTRRQSSSCAASARPSRRRVARAAARRRASSTTRASRARSTWCRASWRSLLLNVTTIVTAMGLARERETGTLEQILVTPIRPVRCCSRASALPFVLFGLVDVLAVLVVGSVVFDVPIRGSLCGAWRSARSSTSSRRSASASSSRR